MDRIAIDFGWMKIYWYSIFIFLAMIVACFVIFKEAKRKQVNQQFLVNLVFYSILLGILGARIYYVIFHLDYYIQYPIEIFQIWNGGLAIHGGILAATFFILYYCKKNKESVLKILDISSPGLIIAQAIGRWGNFFNGEAYGPITTYQDLKNMGIPEFVINGMYIDQEFRQPTFFYESCFCLIGFLCMLGIRKYYKNLKSGQLVGFYLIWYGIGRFFVEALRTDSLMLGPIKMAQLISTIFILLGIFLVMKNKLQKENKDIIYYKSIASKKRQE